MSARKPEALVRDGVALAAAMDVFGMTPAAALIREIVAAVARSNKLPAWDGRGALLFDFDSGESFPVVIREDVTNGCRSYAFEAACDVGGVEAVSFDQRKREAVRAMMMDAKYKTHRSLRLYFEGEEPWTGW